MEREWQLEEWNLDSVHACPFRYANDVVFPFLAVHFIRRDSSQVTIESQLATTSWYNLQVTAGLSTWRTYLTVRYNSSFALHIFYIRGQSGYLTICVQSKESQVTKRWEKFWGLDKMANNEIHFHMLFVSFVRVIFFLGQFVSSMQICPFVCVWHF